MAEQIGIIPTPKLVPVLSANRSLRSLSVRPMQTFRLNSSIAAPTAVPHFLAPFVQA